MPEDIRQQLLSSGILGNADIQILDYDKVSEILLSSLVKDLFYSHVWFYQLRPTLINWFFFFFL